MGNTSSLDVQSILQTVPKPPIVASLTGPRRLEVSISKRARNGEELREVEYQVYKYEGSTNNAKVWKDWSPRDWSTFVDTEVLPNRTYGYAVRYRGKFQDISNLSSWTTTTT